MFKGIKCLQVSLTIFFVHRSKFQLKLDLMSNNEPEKAVNLKCSRVDSVTLTLSRGEIDILCEIKFFCHHLSTTEASGVSGLLVGCGDGGTTCHGITVACTLEKCMKLETRGKCVTKNNK